MAVTLALSSLHCFHSRVLQLRVPQPCEGRRLKTPCAKLSEVATVMKTQGRVFTPPPTDSDWWDKAGLCGPVVIPPAIEQPGRPCPTNPETRHPVSGAGCGSKPSVRGLVDGGSANHIPPSKWRMYYCGRGSDMWAQGVKGIPALPIGRVGLALSDDGVHWERFRGPLPGGAVFDPAESQSAFDCVHVAVNDIIPPWQKDSQAGSESADWIMYYGAGGLTDGTIPDMVLIGKPEVTVPGLPFRIGIATSMDGVHFKRMGMPALSEGSAGQVDEFTVGFPSALPPLPAPLEGGCQVRTQTGSLGKTWLLTYHTRGIEEVDGEARAAFIGCSALSEDGFHWEKNGRILPPSAPGSWDEQGMGSRHILRRNGELLMFYTGVDKQGVYRIGLATSLDGLSWTRAEGAGPQPGGPVLEGRFGENAWDNHSIGAPRVVKRPDGSLWMYYVGGKKGSGALAIGLAVNKSGDGRVWKRWEDMP